jgi:hypothetical protein
VAGNDNGKKSHTDRVRTLAKYIAEQPDDDEITGQHLIDAMKAGVALGVETTSKTRAMSKQEAEEITLTDHGQPPRRPISEAPKSGVPGLIAAVSGGAARIVSAVNNVYALLALTLLVGAFIAWLRLRP